MTNEPTDEARAKVSAQHLAEREWVASQQSKRAISRGLDTCDVEADDIVALQVAAAACGTKITLDLWRAGSYVELLAALALCRETHPDLHAAIWRAWVRGKYANMGNSDRRRAVAGLGLLSQRMPAEIRVPPVFLRALRDEQRVGVKRLLGQGKTLRAISSALGISRAKAMHMRREVLAEEERRS